MDSTLTYKCPNCDAGLIFDAAKQKFTCEFCLSEFTEQELEATDAAERAREADEENAEFCRQMNEYHCQSCGAEFIVDSATASGECCYCHNPIVLVDKLSGAMKPSKIIPFKFDKAEAKRIFLDYAKSKKFAPRDYFSEENAEHISGIYYPFWVTDADTYGTYEAEGRKIRVWYSGDYKYTETSKFNIIRDAEIHFEDITSAAISEEDKNMLEGILPYPADSHIDFSMPYLQGYKSKKRDIDRDKLTGEVRGRMNGYAKEIFSRTVHGYNSVTPKATDVKVERSHWEYTLMPIWLLTYKKKSGDKSYTYAMNGYTGKIYGELPISIPKLLILAGSIFASVSLLLFLFIWFLL